MRNISDHNFSQLNTIIFWLLIMVLGLLCFKVDVKNFGE